MMVDNAAAVMSVAKPSLPMHPAMDAMIGFRLLVLAGKQWRSFQQVRAGIQSESRLQKIIGFLIVAGRLPAVALRPMLGKGDGESQSRRTKTTMQQVVSRQTAMDGCVSNWLTAKTKQRNKKSVATADSILMDTRTN